MPGSGGGRRWTCDIVDILDDSGQQMGTNSTVSVVLLRAEGQNTAGAKYGTRETVMAILTGLIAVGRRQTGE